MSNTTSETIVVAATCHYCEGSFESSTLERVRRERYARGSRTHDMLCPRCVQRQTTLCTHCAERTYTRSTRPTLTGGRIVCETCRYGDDFHSCAHCNRCDPAENMVEQAGNYYCPSCLVQYANFAFGTFLDDGCTNKIGSDRCFGVELETESCDGYYEALVDHPAWGAKEDCSVSGKEFFSAILKGDSGLEAVNEIAEIADENGWEVESNCGFHLHLDMRGEKRDSLYAIAYAYRATQDVWLSFVTRSRRNASYCHTCRWLCSDIDAAVTRRNGLGTRFGNWAGGQDRYDWLTVSAYNVHKTIEIRLHHGTCDGEAVTNWIKANTRFADWASKLGYEGVKEALSGLNVDELFTFVTQEIWRDGELTIYYGTKARDMDGCYLTTSVGRPSTRDDICF